MVAPRHEAFSHTPEERFVGYDADFRGNSMMHLLQVQQFCPESLADGLLAQANAQDALLGGITADERKEDAGLLGDAWSGRKEDFIKVGYIFQRNLVVSMHFDICPHLLQDMEEIVGERIVII